MVTVSAFPVKAPTKAVLVIEVAPVTTPASMLIVPSNKITEPAAGSRFIASPESKVNAPAESMSTIPSAVICIFAASAVASVVTIDKEPSAPAVNTAVSSALPVIVITLPSITTSSTVSAVKSPNEVIAV